VADEGADKLTDETSSCSERSSEAVTLEQFEALLDAGTAHHPLDDASTFTDALRLTASARASANVFLSSLDAVRKRCSARRRENEGTAITRRIPSIAIPIINSISVNPCVHP
jgi:hypothetical protein